MMWIRTFLKDFGPEVTQTNPDKIIDAFCLAWVIVLDDKEQIISGLVRFIVLDDK